MKKVNIIQKLFSILFLSLGVISIVLIIIGIRNIYIADKYIKEGYEDVEARILNALDDKLLDQDNKVQTEDNNNQLKVVDDNIQNKIVDHLPQDLSNNNKTYIQDVESSDDVEPEMLDFLLTFNLEKKYKIAVFTGITTENLKMGSARLETSAFPGQEGNCVIYGHRDSSFKPMKYLKIGDTIEIVTVNGITTYTVNEIYVTSPTDDKISQVSDKKMLTLVTCYPFVLSGPANDRCVVVAYCNN